ncbi:GAF domain-containing hybrid sensor histidine kinase/response regulator [Aliiglaciecola sp. LCG003]|uniref:hybrid sensor histidine kinase/response regulator n=1 Tax=Aliiglaciecola sp. LCG003 TaxID=3053655 RepID=UPI00257424F9|nr:GAF domain-containing hybrid sensor histidine kinase/response regulator [Aliiglaciecola sp. LCG003]WJG10223.1 ATP-binding protein [Aliiglaciecola sp. LCG003]
MISAPPPENEKERLKALLEYDILDTEAERVFDDLTALASEICDTPIALISLVDVERQWFKSKVGLDAQETSRDLAFCAHAIHQQEIFEVKDTFKDERFYDNPLVASDPNIRFYAGAPLISPDGLALGTLCVISDKPKALDEHQRKALSILSREVISQLELRIKIKQVEQINQRKTDFLSNLSHELRTPLNAIISFSQLMINDQTSSLPDTFKTYLNHIDFSGKRLLDLVDSVLDLNKIEAGKLELQNQIISISDFFTSIQGVIQSLATAKGVELKFSVNKDQHETFVIDEPRLSQVVLNLASNAIKFSEPQSIVSINVLFTASSLVIAIQDHGVGIAEEDLPRLFGKFNQVGDTTKNKGFGLGLMITKSLVELMGGSIKLRSKLGEGTLVKVDIPLLSLDQYDKASVIKQTTAKFDTSIRILLVEDNEINQQVATAVFNTLGLSIDIAVSGEQGVEMALKQPYQIIFMDLHLPGIDGFEASKQIKLRLPEQLIVALSADIFVGQEKDLKPAGIANILSKPIDINLLRGLLNQHFLAAC